MLARRVTGVFAAATLLTAAQAQVFVDDVAFVDRAASGEISLGAQRGSIGVIDFDRDGWYDLYFPNVAGQANRLYRNVASPTTPGGRSFTDVTTGSGLDDADGTARGFGGVVVFDYDNDGDSDLYTAGALSGTAGILYRNNADGTFTNVTVPAGARLTAVIPDSLSATDFDHDGDLDLFIAATSSPGRTFTLLRNNGNGTFTDSSGLVPSTSFTGRIYAHVWTDYDHDGWTDCLVCLSATSPLCIRNIAQPFGDRLLVNATTESGFTSIGPIPMGIAMGDHDLDGDLDVAITDGAVGTYFDNNAGVFTRVTPFSTFFGWGTSWIDADNDTRLDNYQAGSWSNSNIDRLFLNKGAGAWTDARNALNTTSLPSQHCARVDFDNDGREDLITINPGRFVSVYHNQSRAANHWSKIVLVPDPTTNADAVGAVVRLTAGNVTQVRELVAGSSFTATEDPRAHFGVGDAEKVDKIEILWPRSGTIFDRTDVFHGPFPTDQILTLKAPPAPCSGDADRDGAVNFRDVTSVLLNIGATATIGAESPGDADNSGRVDFDDITRVLQNWQQDCG